MNRATRLIQRPELEMPREHQQQPLDEEEAVREGHGLVASFWTHLVSEPAIARHLLMNHLQGPEMELLL
jgi:hypothetical protein